MKQPFILYDSQIFDQQKFGGISRYFCEIISHLQIDYDLAVRYTENHYLQEERIGKHCLQLPHWFFKRYASKLYRSNIALTQKLMRKPVPYIYHPTYYSPAFIREIGNHPFIVTVHDMTYERFPDLFLDSKIIIQQKREIITKANHIIAISQHTKKDLIELLGIKPEKIDVIYHGCSLRPTVNHYRLKLPEKYILFVGDRAFYKNFQRLLQAFSIVRQSIPQLHLVCTGKPFSSEENMLIVQTNNASYLHQISVNDSCLAELYNRASLFVYPSYYEGFGIPILEAYSCGCPVALSNATCFPEIAGDAGKYFDPFSVSSMAEAIKGIISNETERTKLILAGKERLKLYSWEKATRETELVYQKLVKRFL